LPPIPSFCLVVPTHIFSHPLLLADKECSHQTNKQHVPAVVLFSSWWMRGCGQSSLLFSQRTVCMVYYTCVDEMNELQMWVMRCSGFVWSSIQMEASKLCCCLCYLLLSVKHPSPCVYIHSLALLSPTGVRLPLCECLSLSL